MTQKAKEKDTNVEAPDGQDEILEHALYLLRDAAACDPRHREIIITFALGCHYQKNNRT